MVRSRVWNFAVAAALVAAAPAVMRGQAKDDKADDKTVVKTEIDKTDGSKLADFKPEQQASKSSVTIGGVTIPYDAYAGTIVVHPKGYDDVPQNRDPNDKSLEAQASMFYVAYFKSDAKGAPRPVTFLYNGGPGSSTVWLHMGAFGPRRVVTADDSHTPAAPYSVVNNEFSLLDASDLVFVDAPGTGFSRIAGKDREKAFYGIDADGEAFARFHRAVSREVRTVEFAEVCVRRKLRNDAVGGARECSWRRRRSLDLNGVILLSQILNFDASADAPQFNPGVDLPYELGVCRPTRRRRGITKSCREGSAICRGCSKKSSTSR